MCGRVNITDNEGVRLLMELVGMPSWPSIQARYNVAPTSQLNALIWQQELQCQECHWGLIPTWARPGQFSSPLINARSETVWEKPSFKNLVKHQRACVPITGFYEWHREGKVKTPYYIYPADESAMFVAGIYQKSSSGSIDLTLLTTAANVPMGKIHHRMPVIIDAKSVEAWLTDDDPEQLSTLMQPAEDNLLTYRKISSYVNNAANEGPDCVVAA